MLMWGMNLCCMILTKLLNIASRAAKLRLLSLSRHTDIYIYTYRSPHWCLPFANTNLQRWQKWVFFHESFRNSKHGKAMSTAPTFVVFEMQIPIVLYFRFYILGFTLIPLKRLRRNLREIRRCSWKKMCCMMRKPTEKIRWENRISTALSPFPSPIGLTAHQFLGTFANC